MAHDTPTTGNPENGDTEDFVVIAVCDQEWRAILYKQELEANDVEVIVTPLEMSMLPAASQGGYRVSVHAHDEDYARSILKAFDERQDGGAPTAG